MSDPEQHGREETRRQLMRFLGLVVAGVVVALGVAFVVFPDILIASRRSYMVSPGGLYGEAGFRVGIGLVLMLTAWASRVPGTLRAIGAVVLVVGLATPFFGVAAARARLDWEAAHVTFLRVEGALIVCLGGIIVSAILPGRLIATQLRQNDDC
jgi:hypothetical protein